MDSTRWRRPLSFSQRRRPPSPLPDPTRADVLYGPYFGAKPLDDISTTTVADPRSRAQLAERARAREQELQAIYALMNASAPINRLPVELLVEVFMYLRHMPFTRWDVVLRVCRRWFVIGATTPKLWCQLKASKSTNFLRTGLARSRDLEVDLEVCQVGGYTFLTSETLSVIAPHSHRVRTLTFGMIGASEVANVIQFLSTNPMPALRWLDARVELRPGPEGQNSDTPAIALSPDRFPKLEEVRLTRLNVFVPTPVFAQLKALDLSSYSGREPTFSLGTLIDIVRSMENVEELTLYEIRIPDMSARPTPPPSDRVTFHKLRNLQLALAAPALKRLLAEMIIPPTTDVYMRASLARTLPADRSGLPVPSNLVHVEVRVLSWEHSFNGYSSLDHRKADPEITIPGHLHLATDFADMRTDDGNALDLGDPLRVLRGAPLEVLQIECAPFTIGDIAWRTMLLDFPKLRELSVTLSGAGGLPSAELHFDALDPSLMPDPAGRVVGAELQTLVVSGWLLAGGIEAFLARVVACLEARRRRLGKEKALGELWLNLRGHESEEASAQAKEAFEGAVWPLVGRFEYSTDDFTPRGGWAWSAMEARRWYF